MRSRLKQTCRRAIEDEVKAKENLEKSYRGRGQGQRRPGEELPRTRSRPKKNMIRAVEDEVKAAGCQDVSSAEGDGPERSPWSAAVGWGAGCATDSEVTSSNPAKEVFFYIIFLLSVFVCVFSLSSRGTPSTYPLVYICNIIYNI